MLCQRETPCTLIWRYRANNHAQHSRVSCHLQTRPPDMFKSQHERPTSWLNTALSRHTLRCNVSRHLPNALEQRRPSYERRQIPSRERIKGATNAHNSTREATVRLIHGHTHCPHCGVAPPRAHEPGVAQATSTCAGAVALVVRDRSQRVDHNRNQERDHSPHRHTQVLCVSRQLCTHTHTHVRTQATELTRSYVWVSM